jgi:2-amino-4-hydroxy-6-hydroxymethyldihydropteridine diphosphokinase
MGVEAEAFVGIGANLGTEEAIRARFERALELLVDDPQVRVIRLSSIYRTKPWGDADQPPFLNAVALLRTSLDPARLLRVLKETEARIGRTATRRWGPREIDLDILLYGRCRVESDSLQVPHPRLLERAFAVVPLLEIDPGAALPDGTPLRSAAAGLLDDPGVTRVCADE